MHRHRMQLALTHHTSDSGLFGVLRWTVQQPSRPACRMDTVPLPNNSQPKVYLLSLPLEV